MNSLAIWFDGTLDDLPKIELHINVWHTQNNGNYIEFGVLVENYDNTDYGKLCISIPYYSDIDNFQDKSEKLKDLNLISALFNEQLSVAEDTAGSKFFKVSNAVQNQFKFWCMEINKNEDLLVNHIQDSNNNHYSIHKIAISPEILEKNQKNIYLRFRIKKIGKIFNQISTNKMLLDGYEEKKAIFEVNVNMIRKLPSDITQYLNKNLHIKLINTFFMTDYLTDIIFESKDRKSARVLENHIWDDYIGYRGSIEKVVAYQWRESEKIVEDGGIPIQDFNIFAKTLTRDNSNYHALKVIAFIVIVGALGGIVGNAITTKCFNGFSPLKICDFKKNKEKEK